MPTLRALITYSTLRKGEVLGACPADISTSQDLPPDVVAAAQARGQARDLDATVAELLAELEKEH